MGEIRVTVNDKLDLFLDELVNSGLYPSKSELVRCGTIHLLKELGLITDLINANKKASSR
jgi:Arc/MetJ-type ribon-helix-helix transcriptional regulator